MQADLPAPKLALDGTGGALAGVIAKQLANNGLLVSYGQMSRKPVTLTADALLDRNIRVRGFSLEAWARAVGKEHRDEVVQATVRDAVEKDAWKQLLSWEPFVGFDVALARAREGYARKMVLVMEPDEAKLEPTPRASLTSPVYWTEDAKN